MADVHSREVRSYNMSKIKGKNTKPEMMVRKYLFARGLRYRLHDKKLPGKPDLVLPKFKTVIFIHGCFWHGHKNCRYYVIPKTRTEWWSDKISKNSEKDIVNTIQLKSIGYNVIEIWECDLKTLKRSITLQSLFEKIMSDAGILF